MILRISVSYHLKLLILPLIPSIGPSRRDSDITETDPKIDHYVKS